ncbi:TPA: acyl carrier protein [Salmonella enterica subsp. enterica serovar Bredeney]|uniref:Acyl carrier protein n=3 Tax=Salmonella enterica TaxID=28901 RepID=A0A5J1T5B1_SALET|nr:phosphopantetheine-binding protein [Salmonella enterica]EAA2100048.1 acyl carrier protein [Salmonella enterica subsp. enterica serovar Bredeney]EAA7354171.1 acyl carrier protein [Salmonella enterica subsp. enterica]EAB7892634.1 acyl carrier protein [Salmonella enterica subsp. enterica serovar Newport]EBW5413673.1 acyl carrier protein [Salmonella enterica subsp. enterica serovar Bonn]EBY7415639.1 acyl carrier protein [Salmonella enterica subsp. enterica serovar Alachua]ECM6271240.1 acyl car
MNNESYNSKFQLVCRLISEACFTPVADIKGPHSLVVDLKMDSIELIDFLLKLEQANYRLDESIISSSLTVDDVVASMKSIRENDRNC